MKPRREILKPGIHVLNSVRVEVFMPVPRSAIEKTIRIMEKRNGEYV